MIVKYEDKKIETGDELLTLSGGICEYIAAYGTDEEGTDCVVLWQKHYDDDADSEYTVSEKPDYVVKNYDYSFSGTLIDDEEWKGYAEDFFDFCNILKKMSDNPRIILEKIVIIGDHPFYNASEGEILEEIMWNYGYRVGPWDINCSIDYLGDHETVITFDQN